MLVCEMRFAFQTDAYSLPFRQSLSMSAVSSIELFDP
jgi:hypothetical protein